MGAVGQAQAADERIGIIGLGYVGLPLALALARHYPVIGVDTDARRLQELKQGIDRTGEAAAQSPEVAQLPMTAQVADAAACTAYIVTAPTPVHADHRPNWSLLETATRDVASVLKKGDLVVFESTVCPGSTESICIPLLEQGANLRVNVDFDCGYSPERISPSEKTVTDVKKVIAASNPAALERMAALYGRIITAGLHRAESIAVAEAAKLAENIQRDVDIAMTNELAMLFDQFGINSAQVFDAAATKWNYRRFTPGLVGGHCIGTDSYYLLERTQRENLPAPVLQAARQANNAVPHYVADRIVQLLPAAAEKSPLLLLGYAFKENCADVRNTLVEPLRQRLCAHGFPVTVCDPVADAAAAEHLYGVTLHTDLQQALAERPRVVVFAVAHQCFREIPADALQGAFVADIKGAAVRANWRL